MKRVEQYRDNIDYGEAIKNTRADNPNEQVIIDVPYGEDMYEDKPIFEVMISETNIKEAFISSFNKVV